MDERGEILTLHITSGVHTGARTRIYKNVKYRIGADLNGDIVVRDEGVAACHVTLDVSEGGVRLEALAESVLIDGRRILPPGHIAQGRLPCHFSLADVQLRLDADDATAGRRSQLSSVPWLRSLRANAWLLLLVFLGAGVGYLLLSEPGVAQNAVTEVQRDETHVSLPVPTAQDVQQALQARLLASDLQGLAVQVDNRLAEVRGVLPEHREAQWQAVQQWFDLHYGLHFVLRSDVVGMTAPKVAIAAVWLGDHPYIVDAEGQRHYQGAMLNEGWMLKSIGQRRIVLVRNGHEHVFGL